MQEFTANEAKQNLGQVIDVALREPVSITKYGRPSVIMTSDADYQEYLAHKYQRLKEAVQAGFEQLERGESSELSADEIAELVLKRRTGQS